MTATPIASAPLTVASIVEAACETIAEIGVERLTVRILSDRLGVSLGSTYHHIPSRQALLTLVAQELFARVESPDLETTDWRGSLRTMMVDIVAVFSAHPGMAVFHLHNLEETRPNPIGDSTEAILHRAGFGDRSARAVMATLFYYLNGVILDESTRQSRAGGQVSEVFLGGLDLILDGA
ncbi:MAG: hypothetical protein JWL70_2151, partial [Acidimicrobiia bacterium]|nr:hypothetical protein [Acidimicrobiia bacterium]